MYTILQGITDAKGKFNLKSKTKHRTYKKALQEFNNIKEAATKFEINSNEHVLTVMCEGFRVLELYKSYRKR